MKVNIERGDIMLHISMPHFGETNFYDTTENAQSRTLIIQEAEASLFERYCAIFEEKGGKLLEPPIGLRRYLTEKTPFLSIISVIRRSYRKP